MSTSMDAFLFSVKDLAPINIGNTTPMVGYHVTLWEGIIRLGTTISTNNQHGMVRFHKYHKAFSLETPRRLTLEVRDVAGRFVPCAGADRRHRIDEQGRLEIEDTDAEFMLLTVYILETEAKGFLVTLGTGETPITLVPGQNFPGQNPARGTGWGLSRENAVTVLVDNEAFAHAAALWRSAKESILLTQLSFSVPDEFHSDASKEKPRTVFAFDPPAPTANNLPRPMRQQDTRPERLLIDAADKGVDVRILMHSFELGLFLKILLSIVVFPFAGSDGIFALDRIVDPWLDADDVELYFRLARHSIKVRAFRQALLNFGVMHARLMIIDGDLAMCMGASFTQSYIDTRQHAIDSPARGGSKSLPNHDVAVSLSGPAVSDIHRSMKLLWDTAAPDDGLDSLPMAPPHQAAGHDGICSIQIVRTLTEDRFDDPAKGEKGVLEAYLRAIASAEHFIYLENQYFIDERIAGALVNVMKQKPALQVIVVLNIKPDQWLLRYPRRQRRLITRIRREIGEKKDDLKRYDPRQFGVFTRWSHEISNPRPRIMPVYVHAKVAIVDDKWATVGSANLDYASMDRAIEVNVNLLNGVDGEPASPVVDILRRKLWAEHLGYFTAPDVPKPADPDLVQPPSDGWLKHWSRRAQATLLQLINQPSLSTTNMARVLPWPADDTTHKEPRDHLTALGIRSHAVVPIKAPRPFDFQAGDWVPKTKAEMDYP